jgi:hypothetical protein
MGQGPPSHNLPAYPLRVRGEGGGGIIFLVIGIFVNAWSGYAAGFRSASPRTSTSFHCAPGEGNFRQKDVESAIFEKPDPFRQALRRLGLAGDTRAAAIRANLEYA